MCTVKSRILKTQVQVSDTTMLNVNRKFTPKITNPFSTIWKTLHIIIETGELRSLPLPHEISKEYTPS
jgi:hypothetical protein